MRSEGFKGRAAEYAFASAAALRGFVIGFPSIEAVPFDFYVSRHSGTVIKVQVKGVFSEKADAVELRKNGGTNYVRADFDVLIIYRQGDFYLVPPGYWTRFKGRLYLSKKVEQYKNNWQILEDALDETL